MTTIERAKRFYKRICLWADDPYVQYRIRISGSVSIMQWCQGPVARALIRQELREAEKISGESMEQWDNGFMFGMSEALHILDTVYGRKEKRT